MSHLPPQQQPSWAKVPGSEELRPCFVCAEAPPFLKKVQIPEGHRLVLWLFVDVFSVIPADDIRPWDDQLAYDEHDQDLVFAVEMAKDAIIHPNWYSREDDFYHELDSTVRDAKPKKAPKEKKAGKEKKAKPAKPAAAPKSKLEAPGVKRARAIQKIKDFLKANPEVLHPLVVTYRENRAKKHENKLMEKAKRRGITVEELRKQEEEAAAKEREAKRVEAEARAELERKKKALLSETPAQRLIRLEGNVNTLIETKEFGHCIKVLNKLLEMDVNESLIMSCQDQVKRLSELRKFPGNDAVREVASKIRTKWKSIVAGDS